MFTLLALLASPAHAGSGVVMKAKGGVEVVADPENAVVVFGRPGKLGAAIKPAIVDETGRVLGELRPGGWFVAKVPPGEHTFVAWGEGTPSMKAELEAGEIYYVDATVTMGAWAARFQLFSVGPDDSDFAGWGPKLAGMTPWAVNEPAAAAYAASRKVDIDVVLAKGEAQWAGYDEADKKKRSLTPDDGVTARIH